LVLAGGMAELRAWIDDLDGVRKVTAAEASNIVVLEVLHQRSTQGNVDDLLAPADAEDGNLLLTCLLEQAKLRLVQLAVDWPDLFVLLLRSEERRVGKRC